MEEECDLNAQFLCTFFKRISILLKKNALFTPHFLHDRNYSKNRLKSSSPTPSRLSSSTVQQKSNQPKQKGHILKNLQHSPE